MAQEPRVYDVRVRQDDTLEQFDGTQWVTYPDVPDEELLPPNAVNRGHGDEPPPGAPGTDDGTP